MGKHADTILSGLLGIINDSTLNEEQIRKIVRDEQNQQPQRQPGAPVSTRYMVGTNCEFETIQAAWEEIDYGERGRIHITESYDPRAESYPIKITPRGDDGEIKTVVVEGQGPGVTRVGHEQIAGDTFDVNGGWVHSYAKAPTFRDMTVVSGSGYGLSLESAPYTTVDNITFVGKGDGLRICESENNSYGVRVTDCQAWNLGGTGYHLDTHAGAHGTSFTDTWATACKGNGFRLSGYATNVKGGGSQMCHGYGIEIRNGGSISLSGMYVEANGRRKDYPVELYAKNVSGLTIRDSYYHGILPRQVWHDHDRVQRGINVHDTRGLNIQNITYRRFGDALIAMFGCENPQTHSDTHTAMDDTPLISE